jgi:carbamoyl-phosphate synthase large subunit
MAASLSIKGFMNVQFIIQDNKVFVLEINLRASRTIPFVSKATKMPLAKIAALCLVDIDLQKQGINFEYSEPEWFSVKVPVFPFSKFSSYKDCFLGPEMKSTGEVMGIDANLEKAYLKGYIAAGYRLSPESKILILECGRPYLNELVKLISKNYKSLAIVDSIESNIDIKSKGLFNNIQKINAIRLEQEDTILQKFDIIVDIPTTKQLIGNSTPIFKRSYDNKILYLNSIRSASIFFRIDIKNGYSIKRLQDYGL